MFSFLAHNFDDLISKIFCSPIWIKSTDPLKRLGIWQKFYNTLLFCILKSLQNVHKSLQSHPKFPKSCIWDIFSLLGIAKQFFFRVNLPSPNRRKPPILQKALRLYVYKRTGGFTTLSSTIRDARPCGPPLIIDWNINYSMISGSKMML